MPEKEHNSHTHGDGAMPSWDALDERNRKLMKVAKKKKAWENRFCSPKEPCTPKTCSDKTNCSWNNYQIEKLGKL